MQSAPAGNLRPRLRLAISLALLFHLTAVVVEPLLFFTRSRRGASEAIAPVRAAMRPYTEMAYLNHGYFFFAPEAGPSHLMRFSLDTQDGAQAELQFPDKSAQWPRLLYHRHFMLSEFLHSSHVPPPDQNLAAENQTAFRSWQQDRNRFEMIRDSYLAHVMDRYDAQSATVTRIEHQLPSDEDVLNNGLSLDDPRLYLELPDEPFELPNEPFSASETQPAPTAIPPGSPLFPGAVPTGPGATGADQGAEVLPRE